MVNSEFLDVVCRLLMLKFGVIHKYILCKFQHEMIHAYLFVTDNNKVS